MATDDERREVARKLRRVPVLTLAGIGDDGERREWEMVPLKELADAVGADYIDHNDTKGHIGVIHRLAELIEPIAPVNSTIEWDWFNYTAHIQYVDRDALFKIADDLEGDGLEDWACGPIHVGRYARRIREAIGVNNDAD